MATFKFLDKKILIISPEPWDFIKVSKHHYAIELHKCGNSVYFLNPPSAQYQSLNVTKSNLGVYVIDSPIKNRGLRFLPKLLRLCLMKRLFTKIQQTAGVFFDIVFLFENSRLYNLEFLPKNIVSIYFQVDEDQRFHPLEAAKSANLVLAINENIRNALLGARQDVYVLPHAFSGQLSRESLKILSGESLYTRINKSIEACYVGNLDHNFCDTSLIIELVRQMHFVNFNFIGPFSNTGTIYSCLNHLPNVRFSGKVDSIEIPGLLDKADLLFFAYTDKFLSSAHKIMEYLASGKAIVTTSVRGYPNDPDLFYHAQSREDFVILFNNVCSTIIHANHELKMKKRIMYALDNTYVKRIIQIEQLLNAATLPN